MSAATLSASRSTVAGVWHRLRSDPIGLVLLVIILAIAASAICAPWLAPFDPNKSSILNRLRPIGYKSFHLGTDEQGRDMLSRLLYGGRISLLAGTVPVAFATLIGGSLGILAGYAGGWVNQLIMRSMDVLFAFPSVLLAIAISALLGGGFANQLLTITLVVIPPICRVAETGASQLRLADFVQAAQASGASRWRIMTQQVAINVLPPVLVFASTQVSASILLAAGLSFLGLGVSPPTADWGLMLSTLRDSVYSQPVVCALPGLAILIVSVAFNLLSDSVREALDVRAGRH